MAQRGELTERRGRFRHENLPCLKCGDRQLPILKRVLPVHPFIFRCASKLLAEIEDKVIEDAFAESATGGESRIVIAAREGIAHLPQERVVVRDDR